MNLETTRSPPFDVGALHVKPLWEQMAKLNPPLPNPVAVPNIWRYDDVRPYLITAGNKISENLAERRVLMLVNPTRDAPYTANTIYAGLQLVMPNETAAAHRHTAFAMRFIIEDCETVSAKMSISAQSLAALVLEDQTCRYPKTARCTLYNGHRSAKTTHTSAVPGVINAADNHWQRTPYRI
ncbi:RmlC-like cupin domain-containing protein [Xylogone sp. PMI_703]|nr:RmlC-like cupin domain-containing protein [Xylogone sp. PMI_703]